MNDKSEPAAEARFAQVPADFPRPVHLGALPGAQPKLLMVKYNGRYYSPGCTPPELRERWDYCEDLARQFCQKCLDNKAGKRAHLSEVAILEQYLERLLKTGWGSDAEMQWLIRRAAALAKWPVPESALEPGPPAAPPPG
ncbi:MAG: hypothetical protein ACXWU9_11860 [Telluria sp.]